MLLRLQVGRKVIGKRTGFLTAERLWPANWPAVSRVWRRRIAGLPAPACGAVWLARIL